MFPLDNKEPYIKANGSRSTLGEMFDEAGADVAQVKAALDDEIEARAALGAHNLLPCTAVSQASENRPTFTVSDDGSVLVNGANSGGDIFFQICNYPILKGSQRYILSGCPAGGASNTYNIVVQDWTDNTVLGRDVGEGATFTSTSNGVKVFIVIRGGKTVSNLTFKPMIRLASDSDTTYQPYAATNQELTKMLTVEDLTSQVTLAENCFSCSLLRQGNICHVNVAAKAGVNGFTSLATVPASLKPKYNTSMACFAVAGADSSKIADAVLNTDGLISIRTTSATSDIAYLSCTWII